MKKHLKICICCLLVILLLLAGCIAEGSEVLIRDDGSGTVEVKVGFTREALGVMKEAFGDIDWTSMIDSSNGTVDAEPIDSSISEIVTTVDSNSLSSSLTEGLDEFSMGGKMYYGIVTEMDFSSPEELVEILCPSVDMSAVEEDEDSSSYGDGEYSNAISGSDVLGYYTFGYIRFEKQGNGSFLLVITYDPDVSSMDSVTGIESGDISTGISSDMMESLSEGTVVQLTFTFPYTVKQLSGYTNGVTRAGNSLYLDYMKLAENGEQTYVFGTGEATWDGREVDPPIYYYDVPETPEPEETTEPEESPDPQESNIVGPMMSLAPIPSEEPSESPEVSPSPEPSKDPQVTTDLTLLDIAQYPIFRTTSSSPKSFPDVKSGAWYYAAVREASALGLVHGDTSRYFRPNDEVTVEEFATMLCNAFNFRTGADDNGWWAYWAMRNCLAKNWISVKGLPKAGTYSVPISREEAVTAMEKAFEEYVNTSIVILNMPSIPDSSTIDSSYYPWILNAYVTGITSGSDSAGTFYPQRSLSRAEACQLFLNMASKAKEICS